MKPKRREEQIQEIKMHSHRTYITMGIDWILKSNEGDEFICTTQAGMANILTRTVQFALDAGGELKGGADGGMYYYHAGTYHKGARRLIQWGMIEVLTHYHKLGEWNPAMLEGVIKFIQCISPTLWARPPIHKINCLNGIIEWSRDDYPKLLPHTPDFLSPVQLPVTWDPEATCQGWHEFIRDTFPSDCITGVDTCFEILAWLMIPLTSIQKSLCLLGDGANGKSTFCRGIQAFLGETNYTSISLHKLEEDKFSTAQLIGKLANICPDVPSKKLETTNVFKSIVGGDAITAERKFSDSFSFTPFARLVFSVNDFPKTTDNSEGFYRRFLILPFLNTFPEDPDVSRKLDALLTSPEELSGVLNRAVRELPSVVYFNGLTETATMKEAAKDIRFATDTFLQWLDSEIEPSEFFIPKQDLYEAYRLDNPKDAMTPAVFSRKVTKRLSHVKSVQKTIKGVHHWCFSSIFWKPASLHYVQPTLCIVKPISS